mmetsp:Transcript_27102/g.45778  ORF Transcript_27102/g.45778 Transcript_27102/m.45778 type:complete len:95 (-) Transcript_27102:291-575(-)
MAVVALEWDDVKETYNSQRGAGFKIKVQTKKQPEPSIKWIIRQTDVATVADYIACFEVGDRTGRFFRKLVGGVGLSFLSKRLIMGLVSMRLLVT